MSDHDLAPDFLRTVGAPRPCRAHSLWWSANFRSSPMVRCLSQATRVRISRRVLIAAKGQPASWRSKGHDNSSSTRAHFFIRAHMVCSVFIHAAPPGKDLFLRMTGTVSQGVGQIPSVQFLNLAGRVASFAEGQWYLTPLAHPRFLRASRLGLGSRRIEPPSDERRRHGRLPRQADVRPRLFSHCIGGRFACQPSRLFCTVSPLCPSCAGRSPSGFGGFRRQDRPRVYPASG
jgi:hypothetical protein